MHTNIKRILTWNIFLIAFLITSIPQSAAEVALSDFFSDFTSSDVNINSSNDLQGKAIFEMFYARSLVESHEVALKLKAGEAATKVIIWEKPPQQDYYTAKVSIYNDSRLLAESSYQISYGTVSMPNFHVVDFSPTNRGVQLLLRAYNPSAVDIKIELLDDNKINYTKTEEDVSLTTTAEFKMSWPFLLQDKKKYLVRAKIFTHRLYSAPLVNTYIASFTATDDIEILPPDVQVDEYGASVTIRGKSQVPFDGFIVVTARNRETNKTQVYRQQFEDILITDMESTAGVVWRGLVPGTYDVVISAVNQKNETVDKYETALRIPENPAAITTTPVKSSPAFEAIIFILMLTAASRRLKGV